MALLLIQTGSDAGELRSLAEIQQRLRAENPVNAGISITGIIRAVNARTGLVVFQDDTSTEILEVSGLAKNRVRGERLELTSEDCGITRGPNGIQMGKVPLLDLDGNHPPATKGAELRLKEGLQPFRLEWFNGGADGSLDLQFGKPGGPLVGMAGSVFHDGESEDGDIIPGLEYACFEGPKWLRLPDFDSMEPVKRGVVQGLDLSVRTRKENVALVFTGYLRIPENGTYSFKLTSDDGSKLLIGAPEIAVRVTSDAAEPQTEPVDVITAPVTGDQGRWARMVGRVVFASSTPEGIILELKNFPRQIPVRLPNIAETPAASLLNKRVEVVGVEKASGITVVDPADFKIVGEEDKSVDVLTSAGEIRRLNADEARKSLQVEIRGVVTMASQGAMVIQDSSGGVYVSFQLVGGMNTPRPGDLWRVKGTTDPGDFSPVVEAQEISFEGLSYLPPPVRPSWEQLLNGSLDAERVEIEGVIVECSRERMRLLTREGIVEILNNDIYPLPQYSSADPTGSGAVGSLVRMRGVYASTWDVSLGRVHPAKLRLGNAVLSIDSPPPVDPFSAPLVSIQDLHRFTSHSNALKRFSLRGMVLHASPPDYMLCEENKGFRITSHQSPSLVPGDLVDAVGFPRMGGPSPMLLEALVRKTGHAELPDPLKVSVTDIPNIDLDSTMVEIEAELLADTVTQGGRSLELRSGTNVFMALFPSRETDLKLIEPRSLLRVRGVYVGVRADQSMDDSGRFELRVLDAAAITILKRGPWWTARHTLLLTAVLSGGLLIAGVWVLVLRRTVAKRSRELAKEIEEREIAERQRVMEQERSRVARDLHDELGAGLTEVGMISSALKNSAVSAQRKNDYLKQLSNVSFYLVTSLDEIVWAVNPRYDSVADLATYFSLFAQKFLELAGIRCRLKIDRSIPILPLEASARHGIFLAFKEALNNVVKHSGAAEVTIRIGVEDEELLIAVSDDGCGFENEGVPTGSDGLIGMEKRVKLLGGRCEIDTDPGSGTCVRFRIPTNKPKS